ncbi:glycosyltransferase [Natronomonas sp. F2-12]|uniref:Glycosyltransferase n=1 Tax=Natronomonas aquatica TaxID=2841590 RepID=A0A9R1CWP9_9EURY|nr:glycosyltransferase [Natronomonas aquatica]MCQ4334956.1 glycosyltransferase [Natronomonas aquatica]
MKISYIYHTNHDTKSAHNNQIIHTCNALIKTGHEVTVFTAGGLREYAAKHDLTISFNVHQTTTLREISSIEQILYYFEAIWAGRSHDVIYTRDISFLKFLTLIPSSAYPPVVFEAHKCHTVVDGMGQDEERRRFKQVDGVITISNGIRSDLEKLGIPVDAVVRDAANVEYIPSATKEDLRRDLGIDDDATVFVYAGSLDPDKYDLKSVIEAFGSIATDRIRLYVLGGESTQIEGLEQYSRSVDLDNIAHFLGHLPQREVFKYLKAADIGLVAQQPTDIRASKYTSPLKLFEYLVSDLVVVATDVPSIAEVADEESRILTYDPSNHTDLRTVLETAAVEWKSLQTGENDMQYSYEDRAQEIHSVLKKYVKS